MALALTCQQFRLALLTQCHWAVVALRQEATVERAVGPKPLNCTWRDEWVPMRMERCTLEKKSYARSTFEKGGVNSIEKVVENGNKSVQWKITNGWGVDDAGAYRAPVQGRPAALAKSINEWSPLYAASVPPMPRVPTAPAAKPAHRRSLAGSVYVCPKRHLCPAGRAAACQRRSRAVPLGHQARAAVAQPVLAVDGGRARRNRRLRVERDKREARALIPKGDEGGAGGRGRRGGRGVGGGGGGQCCGPSSRQRVACEALKGAAPGGPPPGGHVACPGEFVIKL